MKKRTRVRISNAKALVYFAPFSIKLSFNNR